MIIEYKELEIQVYPVSLHWHWSFNDFSGKLHFSRSPKMYSGHAIAAAKLAADAYLKTLEDNPRGPICHTLPNKDELMPAVCRDRDWVEEGKRWMDGNRRWADDVLDAVKWLREMESRRLIVLFAQSYSSYDLILALDYVEQDKDVPPGLMRQISFPAHDVLCI